MKIAVLVIIFSLWGNAVFSQKQILELKVTVKSHKPVTHADMLVRLNFKNNGNTKILIPKKLSYGYVKGFTPYPVANIIWEVEKIEGHKFIQQPVEWDMNPVPDPQPKLFDTLMPQETILHDFSLDSFYNFTKGFYRIRAKYLFSGSDRSKTRFICSKWVTINIINEISFLNQ